MKIIKPYFIIEDQIDGEEILRKIEKAGRTCYKSENKITSDSSKEFVRKIIKNGHHSVLEHEKVTVRMVCDRGITHEIVRHRIASYSQESTRYCDYNNNHVEFILPPWVKLECGYYTELFDLEKANEEVLLSQTWFNHMLWSEKTYQRCRKLGWSPQQARSVLPNSLKTEIVMTANLREWRHFFTLRTSTAAHPQMREIAIPMLKTFKDLIPIIFDDLDDEKR